ncbi:MAG: Sua5/YciO/YrdC/YwlC family protein, partial [Chlamydiota bacterium]
TNGPQIMNKFEGKLDLVLDNGESPIGLASTVLQLTTKIPIILRQGSLLQKDIERVLQKKVSVLQSLSQ